MLKEYGDTRQQIEKDFGKECRIVLDNEFIEKNTSQEMAHIISAYDKHLKQDHIDFVFVHGDRPEALAGAIAARLNNIPVCQIEAGDLSGSIDDSIRHSISKLAHRFLVADKWAKKVLLKMGESQENIFIVGNSSLANEISDEPISKKYDIPFEKYAVLIYHPVTTIAAESIQSEIEDLMKKLEQTDLNYIVIMPNNDLNHQVILKEYQKYAHNKHFLFFESLPLEVFTNLLKKATFLIGNSSCGIKEAPYYSVPVIDIGSRQQNRYQNLKSKYFHHLDSLKNLDRLIKKICKQNKRRKQNVFRGTFFKKLNHIFSESFWMPALQKNPYALIKKNRIKKFFYKIFFLIILCGVALLFFLYTINQKIPIQRTFI